MGLVMKCSFLDFLLLKGHRQGPGAAHQVACEVLRQQKVAASLGIGGNFANEVPEILVLWKFFAKFLGDYLGIGMHWISDRMILSFFGIRPDLPDTGCRILLPDIRANIYQVFKVLNEDHQLLLCGCLLWRKTIKLGKKCIYEFWKIIYEVCLIQNRKIQFTGKPCVVERYNKNKICCPR